MKAQVYTLWVIIWTHLEAMNNRSTRESLPLTCMVCLPCHINYKLAQLSGPWCKLCPELWSAVTASAGKVRGCFFWSLVGNEGMRYPVESLKGPYFPHSLLTTGGGWAAFSRAEDPYETGGRRTTPCRMSFFSSSCMGVPNP